MKVILLICTFLFIYGILAMCIGGSFKNPNIPFMEVHSCLVIVTGCTCLLIARRELK